MAIQNDDLFLVSRNGVNYKITVQELKDYLDAEPALPPPPAVMPWEEHDGAIWHVKNANQEVKFVSLSAAQAYAVDGTDLGKIRSFKPGEELVFLTGTNAKGLFSAIDGEQRTATWDFGEHTDTSKVRNMNEFFSDRNSFNGVLGGNWDTSNVTDMDYTFLSAKAFNQDISGWDVSKVKTMEGMFLKATVFNQPIGTWDVSSVTNMYYMLSDAETFNQDIGGWDVSSVTYMGYMFFNGKAFDKALANWDTSNVKTMDGMFSGATVFNKPIGTWDTSSVTDLEAMFKLAKAFDQDIGDWDVSSVTDSSNMAHMFHGTSLFNQDLSRWCVATITSSPNSFEHGANAWTKDKPCWGHCPRGENGTVDPCPPKVMPWVGHDGGIWHVKNANRTVSFNGGPYQAWKVDGTALGKISNFNVGDEVVFVTGTGVANLFTGNGSAEWDFGELTDTSNVLKMTNMFCECGSFNGTLDGNWDVSNVTKMEYVFSETGAFNQDISGWDVSSVENMSHMFYKAFAFDQDISGWDVSKVATMSYMFGVTKAFDQDISGWDVSGVSSKTNMSAMFSGAIAFNQDLSTWCVTNITSKPSSFDSAATAWTKPKPVWGTCPGPMPWEGQNGIFHIVKNTKDIELKFAVTVYDMDGTNERVTSDITTADGEVVFVAGSSCRSLFEWTTWGGYEFGPLTDTSGVTDMSKMFMYSAGESPNLGIENWDVSNVTDMSEMFSECNFSSDISGWDTSNVRWMEETFRGAKTFNKDLTNWNVSKVTDYYDFNAGGSSLENKNCPKWVN